MSIAAVPEITGPGVSIWLLHYGPCWCRSRPGHSGSFDYVRMRRTVAEVGSLEENLLIVSDRVIDGTGQTYRQVFHEVPDPKLAVSAATCPFAQQFWEELPNGWRPVEEILPIDIHVDACINGEPEVLLATVLGHVLARREAALDQESEPGRWAMENAATDA